VDVLINREAVPKMHRLIDAMGACTIEEEWHPDHMRMMVEKTW